MDMECRSSPSPGTGGSVAVAAAAAVVGNRLDRHELKRDFKRFAVGKAGSSNDFFAILNGGIFISQLFMVKLHWPTMLSPSINHAELCKKVATSIRRSI